MQDKNQNIEKIAATLMKYKRSYYSGDAKVPDEVYDDLEQELSP